MNAATRGERLHGCLTSAFAPADVEVADDSHLHRGHAGAADGRGHFRVRIVSPRFAGMNRLARHRAVYAAVAELLATEIHALGITALTPDEE
jgi:BolA protein